MIIYRYLSRQLFVSTAAVTSVLALILVSGRFIKYMSEAAQGRLVGDVLFAIMAFRLPSFLEMILPLGIFLGILLSYGRLYLESEMTVLTACGVGHRSIVRWTLLPMTCLMLTVGLLSFVISPWGTARSESILYEQKHQSEFETLTPGRFHVSKNLSRVTYTQSLTPDRRLMQNLFIAEETADQHTVITADSGARRLDPESGIQYLDLFDGYRYVGTPGAADFQVVEFERSTIKLADPDVAREVTKIKATSTWALWNSNSAQAHAELQWRFSLPLLVPIVVLMAIPLSRVNPRQGRYLKMLPSIMLYLAYLSLLSGSKAAIEDGNLPAWLGVWWVHGVFFGIAMLLNLWPKIEMAILRKRYAQD